MPDPATTTSPPTLLGGRYLLRGELGHGGMARVHRAVDQVLDREVAVKVLYANLAHDPVFVDRFRREAWAGARLSHPNVVSVYDVAAPVPKGDDPSGDVDGPVYMVLQLVEGPSLREVLLAHRRITPAQALGVLGQAAGGLGAAHDAGLVHRDVKPENVLLTPQGGVKVTDFGLARAAAESTQTFGADVIVGSPHYLSPEAVAAEPLDSRSDVYGLGVVLYECLTGRPPFEGESALATALQHRARRVPRPSAAVPGVTPAVDDVVRRATAPDPADRYEDATAFGRALADAVADEPAPLPRTATPRTTAVIPVTATDTIVGRGAAPPAPDGATDRAPGTPDGPAAGGPPDPDPPVSGSAEDAHEDAHEPDTGDASRPRRRWLRWLLVAALAVSALALGGFLVWDNVLAPVTPIPQVAGAPAGAAESTLQDAGFLVEIADERRHHLEVAEGLVLGQDPTGHARRGTAVTLVLSAGPRQVEIPSLSDRPLQGARTELQDLGLEVSVERTHDEQVAEGHALSTDPAAGEVVDEGSAVTLVVSDGPRPIEVPTVVGEAETAALATLRERGLAPEVVDRRYDPDAPEGAVIAQSPDGGAVLTGGGGVELVVSRGPEPFDMPNVRGQRAQKARKQLEGLGLDVEVERQAGAGSDPGRVYDQDPAPRTRVHPGDAVTLYAYEG